MLIIPCALLEQYLPPDCSATDPRFASGILDGFHDLRYRDGSLLTYPRGWHPLIPRVQDPYRQGWLLGQWYRRLISN
jgi:hypothetical protein